MNIKEIHKIDQKFKVVNGLKLANISLKAMNKYDKYKIRIRHRQLLIKNIKYYRKDTNIVLYGNKVEELPLKPGKNRIMTYLLEILILYIIKINLSK